MLTVSRVFVKETDTDPIELPDRPVSSLPNLVTAAGLDTIARELAQLVAAQAAAVELGDKAALAAVERDLRSWTARRASAHVVGPPADRSVVHFGAAVTVRGDDGRTQTFRIVGEDAACVAAGAGAVRQGGG